MDLQLTGLGSFVKTTMIAEVIFSPSSNPDPVSVFVMMGLCCGVALYKILCDRFLGLIRSMPLMDRICFFVCPFYVKLLTAESDFPTFQICLLFATSIFWGCVCLVSARFDSMRSGWWF